MKMSAVARTRCFAAPSLASLYLLSKAGEPAPTPTAPRWAAEKILPPEPGRKACFQRVYDAKHLQTHPEQKVTELLFFLRVSGYGPGGNYVFDKPDHIFYNFAISIQLVAQRQDLRLERSA